MNLKEISQRDFEIEYFKVLDPEGGTVFSYPKDPSYGSLWEKIEIGKPITIFKDPVYYPHEEKEIAKEISTNLFLFPF